MKIVSKVLTADVRLTELRLEGSTLHLSGLVKEFLPVDVEVSAADVVHTARLAARSLVRRAVRMGRIFLTSARRVRPT